MRCAQLRVSDPILPFYLSLTLTYGLPPYTDQPTADDVCCPPDNVYNLNCAGVDYCCYGVIYAGPRCW